MLGWVLEIWYGFHINNTPFEKVNFVVHKRLNIWQWSEERNATILNLYKDFI